MEGGKRERGNACLMMYVTSWLYLLRITSSRGAFDGVKRNLQSWSGKRERVEKSWTKREGEKKEPKEGESRVCLTDWDFYQLPTAKEATSLFSCSFPALT